MKTVPEDERERQVNEILHNLRGEHFRHTRNVQGKPASLASHTQHPSLPLNLIYPTPDTGTHTWIPGPSPPKSWQSSATEVVDTPAWRARALSLLPRPRPAFTDTGPVPTLTLLCLQLIRARDLVTLAPFIPRHLRRALVRYAAVHAPLSQTELDALREGVTHIDSELIVVGPNTTLRASWRTDRGTAASTASAWDWDAGPAYDMDGDLPPALRVLVVVSSPLDGRATLRAFPRTITHLLLINIPHPVPLSQLPTVCPFVVLLDVSYNTWLHASEIGVEWSKLRQLQVLGLRGCLVTPKLLLELNRGRWENVRVVH